LGLLAGWAVKLVLNYYGALGHKIGILTRETGALNPIASRLKILRTCHWHSWWCLCICGCKTSEMDSMHFSSGQH
jgi:hypothetical protein